MKPRLTAWLANLALVAIATLVSLGAAELTLRHWFPVGFLMLQRDPRYLYKAVPNSRRFKRPFPGSGAKPVLVKINREGRRGELLSRRPGLRVMVYGDSYIQSQGTEVEDTYVYQLQELLRTKLGQSVQALNGGVTGYGPDQESLVMEDEIGAVKPDLVIVAIYTGNDFGDLLRDKLFGLNERQQLVVRHPTLDTEVNREFEEGARQSRFQIVGRMKDAWQSIRRSAFADRIRHIVRPGTPPNRSPAPQPRTNTDRLKEWLADRQKEYRSAVLEQDDLVHDLFRDGYDVDISLEPRSESSQYKRILMERMMERIQGIASSHQTPLMFLFIPSPIDAVDHWDVSVDSTAFPDYRRSEPTDVLERIARDHGFSFVNLFDPFRAHSADGLYWRLDPHWSATGERLAAALTADYIVRNNVLRPQGAAGAR